MVYSEGVTISFDLSDEISLIKIISEGIESVFVVSSISSNSPCSFLEFRVSNSSLTFWKFSYSSSLTPSSSSIERFKKA